MLKDLLKQNRSHRGYDESVPVTRGQLLEMVDCARYAPSSVNRQPFQYYLASDPETVAKIQPLTRWARALPELDLPFPGTRPAAWIVICQNMDWGETVARYQKDVGIVAQTMLLAAAEMGLGGCMIGNFDPPAVKEALGLAENLTSVLLVAVGKPKETIVLTEAKPGDSLNYTRDENNVHYVPKRRLEDIVL